MLSDHQIQRRKGAYLPHWTREGDTYAVTFRLADALPKAVQRENAREREARGYTYSFDMLGEGARTEADAKIADLERARKLTAAVEARRELLNF